MLQTFLDGNLVKLFWGNLGDFYKEITNGGNVFVILKVQEIMGVEIVNLWCYGALNHLEAAASERKLSQGTTWEEVMPHLQRPHDLKQRSKHPLNN